MKKITLENFKIRGYHQYVPFKGVSMELGNSLKGVTDEFNTKIPNSIYNVLEENGLIIDPYYGMNSNYAEWVASRWWVYTTTLHISDLSKNRILVFEGVACKAHYYINDVLLGTSESMFTTQKFNIDRYIKKGDNFIKIIVEHSQDEMGQIGLSSKVDSQRSRFDYKWDFCTRLINIGIYRPVYIEEYDNVYLDSWHIHTISQELSKLEISANLPKYQYKIYIENKLVSEGIAKHCTTSVNIPISSYELWWPNTKGKQHLYNLKIELYLKDKLGYFLEKKIGFKTLKMTPNANTNNNALDYVFNVNGIPIYAKGVNFCPLDQQLGLITKDRLESLFIKLKDSNINFIRVWGGGSFESDDFYDLADKYGILVWQDFIQSSSGIDNYPSELKHFLSLFEDTTIQNIKRIRNHVSIAAFCGGNELMYPSWKPVDLKVHNISLANSIANKYAPEIPFFPSTPSGKRFSYTLTNKNENDDIHGDWTFIGNVEQYHLYNNLSCLFHSEFGCDGLSSLDQLKRIFPENELTPIDHGDNAMWNHHAEWWNTYPRDHSLFGDFKTLEDQIKISQFIQWETIRYALSSHRRDAMHCSGTMIWQINEPYPNASCTSIIEYYGKEKLALKAIKSSYDNIVVSYKYDKLLYEQNEPINVSIYISNEEPIDVKTKVNVIVDGKNVKTLEFQNSLTKYQTIMLDSISFTNVKKSIEFKSFSESNSKKYTSSALLLVKQKNGYADQKSVFEFIKTL